MGSTLASADLAALNALPSMCVGRTPGEALAIVLEALPTALTCDLVYLVLPGSPPESVVPPRRTDGRIAARRDDGHERSRRRR